MMIRYNRVAGTCTVSREGFADVVLLLASPTLDADIVALWAEISPIPERVPAWAAKAALEDAGLLDEAEAKAALLGTTWKWRFAQAAEWFRSDVLPLGTALGLSEAQVDGLMRDAMARAG